MELGPDEAGKGGLGKPSLVTAKDEVVLMKPNLPKKTAA
jgi:hypothetical protein